MPSAFPPFEPLLDVRVDPPSYGWPQATTLVSLNHTARLARHLKRDPGDVRGIDGRTALHVAALVGDYDEMASLLLAAGSDPGATTRLGETPLQYAERYGRVRLAAILRAALNKAQSSNKARRRRPLRRAKAPPTVGTRNVTRTCVCKATLPSEAASSCCTPQPMPAKCCIHSCTGRGQCIGGMCVCPNGTDPLTCRTPLGGGRNSSESGCPHGRPQGLFIGGEGLAITMHAPSIMAGRRALLARDCQHTPVRTLAPGLSGIYSPLDVFLLRALDDPTLRAPSAACAQAAWQPLYGERLYRNIDEGLKWQLKSSLSSRRAVAELPSGAPSHALSLAPVRPPLPHLHEEHQDVGSCGAPMGVYWPGDVILSYWGRADHDCHPADTTLLVVPGGVRRSPRLERTADRWTSVDSELVRRAKYAYDPSRLHQPRNRVLFFRGSTREDRTTPDIAAACFRLDRTPTERRCRDGLYSMGIRQAVHRTIGHLPSVVFESNSSFKEHTYAHELLRATFCLTAPGMGFGVRIVDYVAAACIPVVVRPGRLAMPYEPWLDYSGFSVSVPFARIAELPALLQGMSDEDIRAKRERLKVVHRMFLWDEAYGRAYETTREMLLDSLNRSAMRSAPRRH